MVSTGNHPQMALIQVSELLQFTQIDCNFWGDLLTSITDILGTAVIAGLILPCD